MKWYLKFRSLCYPKNSIECMQGITAPPPTAWGAGHGGKLWHGSPVCLLKNKITWSYFVISDENLFLIHKLVFKCKK